MMKIGVKSWEFDLTVKILLKPVNKEKLLDAIQKYLPKNVSTSQFKMRR